MYVCMYVCVHVCMYVCMYVCMTETLQLLSTNRRDFSYKPAVRTKNYSFSNGNGLIYACEKEKRF